MASGDTLLHIPASDFFPEGGNNPSGAEYGLVPVGKSKGLGFNPGLAAGAVACRRVPAAYAATTGLTLKLLVSDDPNYPSTGKVAKVGVNCGLLGAATVGSPADLTTLGTEATATVTLPATSGNTVEVSVPIVKANMGSVVASSWALFRVRRLGNDAADTAPGRLIVHAVTVLET
jgi:hypothetical protein